MSKRERVQLEPAFMLHGYDYRDSSRIIEFFTREHGRLGILAKGARRPRSKFRALLQPFNELLVSWSGGDLPTLTAVEPRDQQRFLDDRTVYAGFYINELLLRLTAKRDPHPELYEVLRQSMADLVAADLESALRNFEKNMLETLGYGLSLEADRETGEPVIAEAWYQFHVEHGPKKVDGPGGGAIRGQSLLALARGRLSGKSEKRDAKRILRSALDSQLGDRPLQTRRVMAELRR